MPAIVPRRSRVSRATSRISAMEKPSLQSATVATAVSPNSSLTMGPMVPTGRLGRMSCSLLRSFFQVAGNWSEGTSSAISK